MAKSARKTILAIVSVVPDPGSLTDARQEERRDRADDQADERRSPCTSRDPVGKQTRIFDEEPTDRRHRQHS